MTLPKNHNMKLLLADDDKFLRQITAKHLRQAGYDVTEAENGKEAIECAMEEKFPIAVLDIMMPIADGLEVCRTLRKNQLTKHTYIILLTAKDRTEDIITGLASEADEYITKPFVVNEFIARVNAGARIRRMQEEIIKKNKQLRALLNQQSKFLGLAAHDLRAPLSIVNTYVSLLGQDIIGLEETKEICLRRCEGMMQLIDDVLDITKIESGKVKFSPIENHIKQIVESTTFLYRPIAAEKGIKINIDLEYSSSCFCDAKRANDIIGNLLSNAIKFSEENTEIIVKCSDHDENYICISVTDQGAGILPENLNRVFEPFTPIDSLHDKQVPHTGLGLAISHKLVDLHSGKIWAESEGKGKGSTFNFTLPKVPHANDNS
jgi:two-component system sensor histidine kinase/response regulator